ncbi:hypothetical protein V6N13_092410 [Hibiscus sabdariffa]|uniref:C2H2-type domain-containing protein n=1 Tax=Hibiscus sabdariffa TaxID=183260 RepID=A0ABR2CC93_9ROSI
MKRSFFDREIENNLALASYLILLSQGANKYEYVMTECDLTRVFECKTCNRQFSSFQALGGHRASHKKPRLTERDDGVSKNQPSRKLKTHECSICGLEFAIGQALGGHMRSHRASSSEENKHEQMVRPFVKKSNKFLCLDLNLTPLENDLELFKLGKPTRTIDGFL